MKKSVTAREKIFPIFAQKLCELYQSFTSKGKRQESFVKITKLTFTKVTDENEQTVM